MNSTIFSIGIFSLTFYSLFIFLGILVGGYLFLRECKRYEIDLDFAINLIFWVIIFGILGARVYYVVFNLDYYSMYPNEIYKIWNGGLAIHGGILFGLLFTIFYSLRYKIRVLKVTDMLSVSLIIGQAFGRWGNFFNQEAHGGIVEKAELEAIKIIPKFVIEGMNIDGVYYIPTFYYESLWCLIGFILLLIIRRVYKYLKVGQLTGFYLLWYGVGRFIIESLRTDSLMIGEYKVAMIVSLIMILIGLILIIIGFIGSKFDRRYDDYEDDDIRF